MRPQGFPRRFRLSQRREFLRVQRVGRKLHTRHFLVFVLPRPAAGGPDTTTADVASPARLGITVTRKVAKSVRRNRIKRLVREVFRRVREELPMAIDLVFVAKRDAADVTFAEVREEVHELAARLHTPRRER